MQGGLGGGRPQLNPINRAAELLEPTLGRLTFHLPDLFVLPNVYFVVVARVLVDDLEVRWLVRRLSNVWNC